MKPDQEEVVLRTLNFFVGFKKPVKPLTEAMRWNKEQAAGRTQANELPVPQ